MALQSAQDGTTVNEKENHQDNDIPDSLKPPKQKKIWHEVDGRFGWVQVFAAGITFFCLPGVHRCFSLLYQGMIAKYGRSDSVTSWVPSVSGTIRMCSSPLIGLLIQRFNERTVCFLGAVTASVGLALTAISPSIELVFLFYGFCYGIGMNGCLISCQTNIAKYFDEKRGRAMGVVFSCMSIGSLVLSPLIRFLFDEYNYAGAMLILSAIVSHICLSAVLMRPIPDTITKKNDSSHNDPTKNGHDDSQVEFKDLNAENSVTKSYVDFSTEHQNDKYMLAKDSNVTDIEPNKPSDDKIIYSHTSADAEKNIAQVKPITLNAEECKLPSRDQSSTCAKLSKTLTDKLGLSLLKNGGFAVMCAFMIGWVMCLDICLTFQTAIINEMGYSNTQAVASLILYNIIDLPCRLTSGLIYDNRIIRNYKILISAVFFFAMALFQLLLPFALKVNFILGMVCLALTSANRAFVGSQNATVIAMLVGKERFASAISLNRFFQGIGLLISAPLGGFLKDVTGTYAAGYVVTASLLLAVASCYFATKGITQLFRTMRG